MMNNILTHKNSLFKLGSPDHSDFYSVLNLFSNYRFNLMELYNEKTESSNDRCLCVLIVGGTPKNLFMMAEIHIRLEMTLTIWLIKSILT